jgi:hypothetical protein
MFRLAIQVVSHSSNKRGIFSFQIDHSNVQQRYWLNDYQWFCGSACACTSYHADCPSVGITRHTRAAERSTTSIPATVLPGFFTCAYQWLQGIAVVFKGWAAENLDFHTFQNT